MYSVTLEENLGLSVQPLGGARYVKFAFLDAVNAGADPVDALSEYIDAMNAEITRKREEFGMKTLAADEVPPNLPSDYKHT